MQKRPLWLFKYSLYPGSWPSREKFKYPPQSGSGLFYCLTHHHSPPQALHVPQAVGVPHKTCCPELSTDPGQRDSGCVYQVHPFQPPERTLSSTEPKVVGMLLLAISCFRCIWSLCSWLFFTLTAANTISTSLVHLFYILKPKCTPINFYSVVLSPTFTP